jgi:hypothetical protein
LWSQASEEFVEVGSLVHLRHPEHELRLGNVEFLVSDTPEEGVNANEFVGQCPVVVPPLLTGCEIADDRRTEFSGRTEMVGKRRQKFFENLL